MNPPLRNRPVGHGTPTARPLTPAEPVSPLSEARFHALRAAVAARRPVQRAARTARGSAMSMLVIAAASVPLVVLYPSWLGAAVVTGIGILGVLEYMGARRMRRADLSAARFLGCNQLAFLLLIVGYCSVQMLTFSKTELSAQWKSSDVQTQLAQLPELQADVEREIERWAPTVTYAFYGLVMTLSIAVQGGMSVYYFTRRRHLRAAAEQTPAWAQRIFGLLET